MLPEIEFWKPKDKELDTIKVTLSGGYNNNFMTFDYAMNKFIFHGLTIQSVLDGGKWPV